MRGYAVKHAVCRADLLLLTSYCGDEDARSDEAEGEDFKALAHAMGFVYNPTDTATRLAPAKHEEQEFLAGEDVEDDSLAGRDFDQNREYVLSCSRIGRWEEDDPDTMEKHAVDDSDASASISVETLRELMRKYRAKALSQSLPLSDWKHLSIFLQGCFSRLN